jgi:deazaflavin-dependent oxidoreductase (nitroreductase family)
LPNVRWLIALITLVHRSLYLRSGGWIGGRALWIRFLLLTSVGRKTGVRHSTPLLYVEVQGLFVVAASNGGDQRDPHWWLNLKRHPEAEIQVGRRRIAVRARPANEHEGEALWPLLTYSWRFFPRYRERVRREIPVVILEPLDPGLSPGGAAAPPASPA